VITLIEAKEYRCLRYVRQSLDPFQVLVGPNGGGKSIFLDVVAFLGQFVRDGLEAAVGHRAPTFTDLVWNRMGDRFALAVEARLPLERRTERGGTQYDTVRYEVHLQGDSSGAGMDVAEETVLLLPSAEDSSNPRPTLHWRGGDRDAVDREGDAGGKLVIWKSAEGNTSYRLEVTDPTCAGHNVVFRLGPTKSALGNLPEDETAFPASVWLKGLLMSGVETVQLDTAALRRASPPSRQRGLGPGGVNLPWRVRELARGSRERYRGWIAHLRTSLPDIQEVRTLLRPEDRHCYLMVFYDRQVHVPSWVESDGTLRLIALTLPAYLSDTRGVLLIEEPENGIHPQAIETAFQSLSSVYGGQVLLATHSPVILSLSELEPVLCFRKTAEGGVEIVRGCDHPALVEWKGSPSLGLMFAAGALG
jgi:predicted ATPase